MLHMCNVINVMSQMPHTSTLTLHTTARAEALFARRGPAGALLGLGLELDA